MKKLLIGLLLIITTQSFGQVVWPKVPPTFQQFGSSTTWSQFNGTVYPVVGFITPTYDDTTVANGNGYAKFMPFNIISTSDGGFWRRNFAATKWEEISIGGTPSTPTWQQTLTAGSTLTESNTVNGGTNDLFFVNMGEVDIESGISGIRLLSSNNRNSEIRVQQDTISLKPGLGTLIIDTLANIPGTKSMRYNPTTGLVSYADTTTMVYPGAGIPNSTGSAWGTSYSTTGSGTVVALATQPTFTTDITTPMIVGGSATGQKITLKTTTGVGSGDSILFKGGNNGATTYASIQSAGLNLLDNSYLKIGGSNILHFSTGSNNATFAGAYNFLFNNGGNVFMNSANTTYFSTSTGDLYFSGTGKLGIGTATPTVALDVVGDIHGTGATTLDLSGTGLNVLVGGEIQFFIDNINGNWILGDAANAFSNKVRISGDNPGNIISLDAATVKFVNYGAGAATFDASGNISSVSDVRLKNVQGGYSVGLSALMNIKPIVYKWNEKSKMETEHNYIGFSAQNILSALGQDATGINKDGYLSIQDRAIMATMVVAIQEQQVMIETLQKEIKKLKRK